MKSPPIMAFEMGVTTMSTQYKVSLLAIAFLLLPCMLNPAAAMSKEAATAECRAQFKGEFRRASGSAQSSDVQVRYRQCIQEKMKQK
jgi:hypothetical protein